MSEFNASALVCKNPIQFNRPKHCSCNRSVPLKVTAADLAPLHVLRRRPVSRLLSAWEAVLVSRFTGAHADMQKYRWPGYEIQLLGELQRQQNNAQFCDTLLQTEGISVPTHSCVLAALSPYLSQKLSASPSPPSGQKRQLKLQAVKAHTLLKLVGLLYSGELEVKGSIEQDDVLSAARQFGIADLLEGQKDGGMREGDPQRKSFGSCREEEEEEESRERNESRKMQGAQVQSEMAGRRDTIEKRSCVSTGTQTVKAGDKTAGPSFTHTCQTQPLTREPASSVAQSLDFSILLQPQNITLERHVCSSSFPPIPSMPSGAPSDGESALDRSPDSLTNPKSASALSSNVMTFPFPLDDNSNSQTPLGDGTSQQSSESADSVEVLAKEGTLEDGKMTDSRENTEQPSHGNRDEMLGEEKGSCTEKRHAHTNIGTKSVAKMKQMQQVMETTQISIKVKLRRRTKGEVWEVVSKQDTDETLSVLTSLKQDVSNHKRPHADLTDGEPPPSSIQPGPIHKPETLILQPPTTNSSEPPPHPNTASDSQPLSSDRFTPHQNDGLESAPLPQHPGPVEESDEQIEKLLEDIMMGLNILPNLERDCKKSHHLQLSHDGAPTICQVPVTGSDRAQSQMHAAVSAAECVYYQDFGTQSDHSSTDTVLHSLSASHFITPAVSPEPDFSPQSKCPHCYLSSCQPSTIQNPLPNTNHLSFVNSRWIDDGLPTCCAGIHCCFTAQNQQQPSVTSMGQRDGTRHRGTPLSQSQNCPYPEAPTTRLVIPTAFYSSEQKLLYPACQEPSLQDNQNILEFLPLTNGNEPSHAFSLPCMDDLRLPQCLSPLEPSTSSATHQRILGNSANHSDKIQPQPSLHGRPWLTENPRSLQFPLCAIRENKHASLPQDTRRSCLSKQRQKHLELNPQNRGTWAESYTLKKVEERGTISAADQNMAELKPDPRKVKDSLKCKQGDPKGDAAVPKRRKRKRTSHPQNAVSSLLAYKDVKVSDGTKSQINLSVCSVRLSSNNVLAKEREMATSSSNMPNRFVGKPSEPSNIAESRREKARGPEDLDSDQTRIRTRGFLKKTQDTPSNTSLENSFLKPVARRAKIVSKQEVSLPRRKRGRPAKRKLGESPAESSPGVIERKSHNVERELHVDKNLPKEEEGEKTKRCKKRRRSRSEVEVIPLKKTRSAESPCKVEADDNNDVIPAGRKPGTLQRPVMVTLKEFQKLIERQHSKIRKSRKSWETNETARDEEREGKAGGSRFEELTEETAPDSTQPQNRDGTEESRFIFNVTVDKNHNQIFNNSTAAYKSQRDDTNSSTSKETGVLGDECHPVFSFDVLGEEVAKLAAERENPDEARKASDAGVSDTARYIVDSSRLCGDAHLPLEDEVPWDHDLNPRTPERTGPPLSDAVGFRKSSGCDQEKEEEEEVEVDVLLYSPDKVPRTRECENGLDNVHVTPEEEEEEDVHEIDVTGDEAE